MPSGPETGPMEGRRITSAIAVCSLLLAGLLLLGTRFDLRAESVGEVRYTASDRRGSWTGRAPVETLALSFDDENLRRFSLDVVVDPARFSSGNFIRDANGRRTVFETERYPRIRFGADRLATDIKSLPAATRRNLTVQGVLDLHGLSRQLELPVSVERTVAADGAEVLRVESRFKVSLSDFEMSRPSLFGVRVDDEVMVEVELELPLDPRTP